MHQKFPQSSIVLRVFALVLAFAISAVAAMAQEKATNTAPVPPELTVAPGANSAPGDTRIPAIDPAPRKATEVPAAASTPPAKSNNNPGLVASNVSSDYKKSLSDLEALYVREAQRVETQNTQLKKLYRDGLVARVDVEKSDKELADAQARVEQTRNQLAEANQPKPPLTAASENLAESNVAWSTGNPRVDNLVRLNGNKYGVDPYLIYCLMHQESRFTNNSTSPKGAQGLMQLMPGTAARYGVTNPYDVAQNISGGTHYLKDLLQLFNGRIDLALAGYNAGENAVIKHGYKVPPYEETRNYVRLITARYAMKPAS
jgi:soluble lytic murein transglycosylase-like protein